MFTGERIEFFIASNLTESFPDSPVKAGQFWRPGKTGMMPLKEFLESQVGVPAPFLTEESCLSRRWSLKELLDLPEEAIVAFLTQDEISVGISQAISPCLDTELPNGFNRHDMGHFTRNYQRARAILESAQAVNPTIGLQENDGKLLVIAAFLHDWGNLFGRRNHWASSLLWLETIFADWQESGLENEKALLKEMIFFHDEKALMQAENEGFLDELSMLTKALFVADKMDVNHRRTSVKIADSLTEQAVIDSDPHITLVAAVDTERLTYEPAEHSLIWQLRTAWSQYADLVRPASYPTHWLEETTAFPAREQLNECFLRDSLVIYNSRFRLMMACLFSLFPQAEEFSLSVGGGYGEAGEWDFASWWSGTATRVFRRGEYQQQLIQMMKDNAALADMTSVYKPLSAGLRWRLKLGELAEQTYFWPVNYPIGWGGEQLWDLSFLLMAQELKRTRDGQDICDEVAVFSDGSVRCRSASYTQLGGLVSCTGWREMPLLALSRGGWGGTAEKVLVLARSLGDKLLAYGYPAKQIGRLLELVPALLAAGVNEVPEGWSP